VVNTSHGLYHILADFDRGRIRLGIAAENESEVYMQHLSRSRNEQILKVTVSNTKEISDCAVTSTGEHIILHDFR
jgi:hypothetical protein